MSPRRSYTFPFDYQAVGLVPPLSSLEPYMNRFISQQMPLEFWTRLQSRLEAEFETLCGRLAEALKPTPVTIDTAGLVLQRADSARGAVFAQIQEMEDLQLLLMLLRGQVRDTTYDANIPGVEAHIFCLRSVASLFELHLTGLPRRQLAEQEIQALQAKFEGLRTSGNGDSVVGERARLRSVTTDLPVLGAEDVRDHERATRSLRASIDQKEAELQTLRVSTQMRLVVPPNLATLVTSFGVQMFEEPEVVEPAAKQEIDVAVAEEPSANAAEKE